MQQPGTSRKGAGWSGAAALTIMVLGLLLSVSHPASLPASAQPRPTLTPSPAPHQPAPTTSADGPEPQVTCHSICGRVINLKSSAGEAGLTVSFGDAEWAMEEVTDADGNYAFGRMGSEVHLLNLVLPENSGLRPLTTDIALAPPLGWATVVNLGVYGGAWAAPLVAPAMRVEPTWARPGDQVIFTAQVENCLTTKISGVRVTDLLPQGFILTSVTSDRGDVTQIGNYGTAFVGDLEPGGVVTVRLVADIAADASPGVLNNRVSLIYSEHAAAQATAAVTVGGAAAAGDSSGDASTGSPTFLPITGYGLTAIGAGLTLGAISLAARYIRKRRRRSSPPLGKGTP